MKKWWIGGGRTQTGLYFEDRSSFEKALEKLSWYKVVKKPKLTSGYDVYFDGEKVAETYKKRSLYKWFLEPRGVDYTKLISKRLEPDNAIYTVINNHLFIIEMKFQHVTWSVDEKLQTCDFKNKQYQRLLQGTWVEVSYCYILSEWFMRPEYRDVINYIQAVWCNCFFWELPLDYLGLPDPR